MFEGGFPENVPCRGTDKIPTPEGIGGGFL